MVIVLLSLAFLTGAILLAYFGSDYDKRFIASLTGIIGGILAALIILMPLGGSYDSYLNQRAFYDNVVNQYRHSVKMYGEWAVLDFGDKTSLTDFKYEGYQKNIAQLIIDLRGQIASYNRTYIRKKRMDANPFFSWLIIPPDGDMKLLRMEE